ncbi:MAG: DUF5777 family beta-barrel protein [Flavobacteriaceae bacterium]|nr:DUF5777 family beta-barrel protein [Flavobacteriaceae bacterium]
MKNYIIILFALLMLPLIANAQDDAKKDVDTIKKVKEKLQRSAFESSFIIDNPTNVVLKKNEMEIQFNHRFGLLNLDKNDMAGIWGASNIRIGANYGVHERVTIGVGTTKFDRLIDFNAKVALLRQTRSEKMPISLTYYGNWVIDARQKNQGLYPRDVTDRWSFFNQLIVARRFSPNFSAQATISISHYNIVANTMRNDMVAFSVGGRYKITDNTAILIDYSQPITEFLKDNPHPGFSLGVEFGTSAHAFQLFITNYNGIVPQKNYMFNQNDIFKGDFLLGFNITRIYNF